MSFTTLLNPSHCHSSYTPLSKLSQHIQTDYSLKKEFWNNTTNNEERTKIKTTSFRSKKIEKSTIDNHNTSQVLTEEFQQYQPHNINPNSFTLSPLQKSLYQAYENYPPSNSSYLPSLPSLGSTTSASNIYNDKAYSLISEFEQYEQSPLSPLSTSSSTSTSSSLSSSPTFILQHIPQQMMPKYNHHLLLNTTRINPINIYNNNCTNKNNVNSKTVNKEYNLREEDWEKAFNSYDDKDGIVINKLNQHAILENEPILDTTKTQSIVEQQQQQQPDIILNNNPFVLTEENDNPLLVEEEKKEIDHLSSLTAIQWKTLGTTLQENNDDKSAIKAFTNAINIDPSLNDAWLGLATSYTNEQERMKVYQCLASWLLNNQQYQHIIKKEKTLLKEIASMVHHNEKEYNCHDYYHHQLIECYLKVARSIPGRKEEVGDDQYNTKEMNIDTDVQIILGLLFYLSKDHMEIEKSIDCFETALTYKSDDYRIWNQLGAILSQQQHHDHHQVIEMYQSALQLNQTFVRARYNLAILYMKMGLYESAAHHLTIGLTYQQSSIMEIDDIYKSSFDSNDIWSSLRLVMYMLNLDHLAEACNIKDLSQFDYFKQLDC
ncbi:unnamed protein product [Cunninghamella blakesleeana]